MQSGNAARVGLSAATTESNVFSGNLQDGPGGVVERAQLRSRQLDPAPEARAGVNYWNARNRPLEGVL